MADCVENMNIVPGAQANGLGRYCCPNQPCCPSMIAGPTGPTGAVIYAQLMGHFFRRSCRCHFGYFR